MRFFIILALILVLYYLFKGLFRSGGGERSSPRRSTDGGGTVAGHELVKDPYCQTYIPKDTALRARVGGRERFFCSRDCMEKYMEAEKRGSSERG